MAPAVEVADLRAGCVPCSAAAAPSGLVLRTQRSTAHAPAKTGPLARCGCTAPHHVAQPSSTTSRRRSRSPRPPRSSSVCSTLHARPPCAAHTHNGLNATDRCSRSGHTDMHSITSTPECVVRSRYRTPLTPSIRQRERRCSLKFGFALLVGEFREPELRRTTPDLTDKDGHKDALGPGWRPRSTRPATAWIPLIPLLSVYRPNVFALTAQRTALRTTSTPAPSTSTPPSYTAERW